MRVGHAGNGHCEGRNRWMLQLMLSAVADGHGATMELDTISGERMRVGRKAESALFRVQLGGQMNVIGVRERPVAKVGVLPVVAAWVLPARGKRSSFADTRPSHHSSAGGKLALGNLAIASCVSCLQIVVFLGGPDPLAAATGVHDRRVGCAGARSH